MCIRKMLHFEGKYAPKHMGIEAIAANEYNLIDTTAEMREMVDKIALSNLILTPK